MIHTSKYRIPDPDLNWAKIQDPELNSMYLDPEHRAHLESTGTRTVWFIVPTVPDILRPAPRKQILISIFPQKLK